MGKTFKEMSSTMKCIRVTTISILLIYSIVTLALAIKSYNELEQNVTIITDTVDNWQTKAITDIQIGSNGGCSSGYELAYTYTWEGTNSGCDCTTSSNSNFNKIGRKSSVCNSTETTNGCTQITAYSSRTLNNIGTVSSNPSNICVKRSSETWADIAQVSGSTCPSGYTPCGLTSDPDNMYCTKEASCPINDISIEPSTCATCLLLDTGLYLKYSNANSNDKLPLAEFRLNEYGMCYEANQKARTPGRTYYFLYKGTTYDCDGEGNALWNNLYKKTESSLFALNGDMTTVITYLSTKGYYQSGKSGADYNWYVYNRGYVPWKINCRSMMDDIINKSRDLTSVKNAHLGMMIVTIISTIVLGVILTIMEIMNLCGRDLPCFQGTGEEERQRILKFKRGLTLGVKLLLLPFQIWAIVSLVHSKGLIQEVADNNCSTDLMNSLINQASDSLQNAFKSDVGAIAALLACLIMSLVSSCCQEKQEKKERDPSLDESFRYENKKVQDPNQENNISMNQSQLALQQNTYQDPYQQTPYQQQPPYQQQQPYQQDPYQQLQQSYGQQQFYQQQQQQNEQQNHQGQFEQPYVNQQFQGGFAQPFQAQPQNYQANPFQAQGYFQQGSQPQNQQIIIQIEAPNFSGGKENLQGNVGHEQNRNEGLGQQQNNFA